MYQNCTGFNYQALESYFQLTLALILCIDINETLDMFHALVCGKV